jgi:conjugal transfer/type IV secretion protein DotA/TraY
VSTLDAVAQKYAQTDSEYINFYYTSTNQTSQTLTPGGTVSFPGYQGPGTGSFNAPTNAPPEWVQNYCNAGLSTSSGISGASLHCCANGDGCDTNLFNQALPYTSSSSTANDTNYTTPDTTTIQKLYAPYAMGPFLNNQDFIAAATNQYIGALSGAYASYITSLPPQQLTGWEGDASQNGWILAGLYYYKMAKNNENNSVTLGTLPPMQVSPPASTVTSTNYNTNDPKSYPRSNYDPTNTLSEAIQSQAKGGNGAGASMSSGAGNGIPPQMSALTQSISGSVSNLLATFQSDMLGGKTGGAYGRIYAHSLSPGDMVTNPMANMASYGNFLMNLVVGMYAATTAALAIAAFLGGFTFEIAGTGLTANPIYEAFKAVWGMISPFYTLLLCSLFSLGALLSIYVPLIPYMIFTMGAIGWFIATIEAMAAGPFIALGILSAGGQHELLSRAEPSVMIIFNLMLRPSLMVFGMMTSILLAVVVFTMMNQGFSMVVGSILDNPPGPAKSVIFIAAYTSMSVTVMSKVCSPIHVIAEKVLTYIGGQAIQYGEQEALGAMKQAVEGAAGGVEGAGKESAPAAAAGVTAHMTAKAHKAEVAKAAQREEALHAKRNPPKDGGGGAPPVGGGH